MANVSGPAVSVLMSCYNASRWLHDAIDSILCQTFQDFEVVLVDDGSTDDTPDIVRRYANRDHRIVAVTKDNTGLADSLNAGMAQATGQWIARLDADDLCEPNRLDRQIRFLRDHPDVILLGSGFVEINETGASIARYHYPGDHGRLVRHLRRMMRFFPHSSAVFKREIALGAGAYNPLFQKAQDWDLWLRMSERGAITCLPDCLVKIRKHTEQISASPSGYPQLAYGVAASVCHFLRANNSKVLPDDAGAGEQVWPQFLAWVDRRMDDAGVYERRKMWMELRSRSSDKQHSLARFLSQMHKLSKSSHVGTFVKEKLVGTALPKLLAKEWMITPTQ